MRVTTDPKGFTLGQCFSAVFAADHKLAVLSCIKSILHDLNSFYLCLSARIIFNANSTICFLLTISLLHFHFIDLYCMIAILVFLVICALSVTTDFGSFVLKMSFIDQLWYLV